MCSNCSGDYENPDATANVQLCECGHDVELHDSLGCQVRSLTFRCKCKRTINELLFGREIDPKLIRLQELLDEVRELISGYVDIKDGENGPLPNSAMRATQIIDEMDQVLAKWGTT